MELAKAKEFASKRTTTVTTEKEGYAGNSTL